MSVFFLAPSEYVSRSVASVHFIIVPLFPRLIDSVSLLIITNATVLIAAANRIRLYLPCRFWHSTNGLHIYAAHLLLAIYSRIVKHESESGYEW